jgi:DNA-binding phage protein
MLNIREILDRAERLAGFKSASQAARALGMSRQGYSQIKNSGNCTLSTLSKISEAFGFDLMVPNPRLTVFHDVEPFFEDTDAE